MEKTMEKSLSIHDPPEGCIHITVKIFLQLSRDFFVQKMGYIQVVFWCTAVASRHKHRICEVHKKKNVQKKHHFYHFTSPNLLVSLKLGARAASTAPSSSDRWAGYQAMPALVLPPGKFKSIKKRNNKNDLRNKNRNPNIMN